MVVCARWRSSPDDRDHSTCPSREQLAEGGAVHDAVSVEIARSVRSPRGQKDAEVGAVHDAVSVEIARHAQVQVPIENVRSAGIHGDVV